MKSNEKKMVRRGDTEKVERTSWLGNSLHRIPADNAPTSLVTSQ